MEEELGAQTVLLQWQFECLKYQFDVTAESIYILGITHCLETDLIEWTLIYFLADKILKKKYSTK